MLGNQLAVIKSCLRIPAILTMLVTAACLLPGMVGAAGLSFLPDVAPADIHPVRANLSVLTYRVPGGLLVADRLAPGHETRYGQAFAARFQKSEFYLVLEKAHPVSAEEMTQCVATLGHVHWQSDDVFVIEVPAENQILFAALNIDRTRIPLDAPPAGWDRDLGQPATVPAAIVEKELGSIQDFVDNISEAAYFQTIQEISGHISFSFNGLQSVSTRFYNTADKDLIGDYLAAQLTDMGYTVEFDPFMSGSTPCRNIVATRTGTTYPDEFVVVGGHYDSISQNPTVLAPGAEDNGSGTAAVMEIARISAGREFERTVQFVLFDSEEQGLYGSYHFVADATSAGRDIIAAITMDMVAYYNTHYSVRIEGETEWEWLMSIMENRTNLHTDIGNQKDYFSWGSDHVPFQQAGIPAFLAIDYDYASYPGYHRTTDTWSQISSTAHIGTQITTACAATLAEVAVLQPEASPVGDVPALGPIDLVAYPNPFNPQVIIAFSSDLELNGELTVYDLTGKRVAVLFRGGFSSGLNRVSWDGKDESGRAVSSGAYICQLKAGDRTTSVSVNLVR